VAETAKRSVYMDSSQADEVGVLAERHLRTWSLELEWLIRLGLRARHLLPAACPRLDEGQARKYFYPPVALSDELDDLQRDLNDARAEGAASWSFSSLVRTLVTLGMRIERQIARGIDAAVERLEWSADRKAPTRALALTLVMRYSSEQLVEYLDAPPAHLGATWGPEVLDRWDDVIAVALDARGRLETLEDSK